MPSHTKRESTHRNTHIQGTHIDTDTATDAQQIEWTKQGLCRRGGVYGCVCVCVCVCVRVYKTHVYMYGQELANQWMMRRLLRMMHTRIRV